MRYPFAALIISLLVMACSDNAPSGNGSSSGGSSGATSAGGSTSTAGGSTGGSNSSGGASTGGASAAGGAAGNGTGAQAGTAGSGGSYAARCRDFGPVRALPGAVGFGAATPGGRGGRVIYVDNLDDAGPGSLRAAIETSGPRVVVFSVGGTITLNSTLHISEPFITIAGQSAPGGGIALRTAPSVTSPVMISRADDVVIQHLRLRPGASTGPANSIDAITVTAGKRIMLANNSFSWATDENVNFWYDASDITLQDNIISEGLWHSTHEKGAHSKGFIAGPDNKRMSLVRNLFASNDDRNPLLQSGGPYEIVNNVIYNGYQVGTSMALLSDTQANLIGNVYLPGPNYRPSRYQVIVYGADGGPLYDHTVYAHDNLSPRSDPTDDWAAMGWGGINGGDYNGSPLPSSVRSLTAFPMSSAPVTVTPSAQLVTTLLSTVGATLPARDPVDTRIVGDVENGTGGLIDDPSEVGGWPNLAAGTAPLDTDRDGLPDAWEQAHGLNSADPADSAADRDGDGYTNIEEYLYCL